MEMNQNAHDAIEQILGRPLKRKTQWPDMPEEVETAIETVAGHFNIPRESLVSKSRGKADVSAARMLSMWLICKGLMRSQEETGSYFSRDRTTVTHALKTVEKWKSDLNVQQYLDELLLVFAHEIEDGEDLI